MQLSFLEKKTTNCTSWVKLHKTHWKILITVEPCHTVTWLLRPLFCPSKMPMFSHKKTCLRGHPVNTANNHILKSQPVQSFIILPCFLATQTSYVQLSIIYVLWPQLLFQSFKKLHQHWCLLKNCCSGIVIYLRH